jgi:hypothetical protein
LAAIKRFDEEIAELAPQHPDYALFDALPGAGPLKALQRRGSPLLNQMMAAK